MNKNSRIRGIIAAQANGAGLHEQVSQVLANLDGSFQAFKAQHGSRIAEIEAAVGEHAQTLAALSLNGPAIHPAAGLRLPGGHLPAISEPAAAGFRSELRGMPYAAMTTQSDPDGGFSVYPEVDGVLEAALRDQSVMRGLCRVVTLPMGRGSWEKIVPRAGAQSSWVGEEETRSDTASPTLGKVTITPGEVYALPELTNAVLEDSAFDLSSFLSEDVAGEFALTEGEAFISGDGIKKPSGFLSRPTSTAADASRAFGTLQFVTSGHASGFASADPADKLHDLLTALRPAYRKGQGVAWLMNSATANIVRKWKDGQGNYLWTSSIALGQPDRLLGYPVAIDEGMPDVAANAFPIAFGDWQRGYAIVDKPGLRLIVDKLTKKGWTKMYFYKRVGGNVVDSNAIKLLKIAA